MWQMRPLPSSDPVVSGIVLVERDEALEQQGWWRQHDAGADGVFEFLDDDGKLVGETRPLKWAGRPVFYVDTHGMPGMASLVRTGDTNRAWAGGAQLAELVSGTRQFRDAYATHGSALNVVLVVCKAGVGGLGLMANSFALHLPDPSLAVWASPFVVSFSSDGILCVVAPVDDPQAWLKYGGSTQPRAVLTLPQQARGISLRKASDTRFHRAIVLPVGWDSLAPQLYVVDAERRGAGVRAFIDDGQGGGTYVTWNAKELANALYPVGAPRLAPPLAGLDPSAQRPNDQRWVRVLVLVDDAGISGLGAQLAQHLAAASDGHVTVIAPRGLLSQRLSGPPVNPAHDGPVEPVEPSATSDSAGQVLVDVVETVDQSDADPEPWKIVMEWPPRTAIPQLAIRPSAASAAPGPATVLPSPGVQGAQGLADRAGSPAARQSTPTTTPTGTAPVVRSELVTDRNGKNVVWFRTDDEAGVDERDAVSLMQAPAGFLGVHVHNHQDPNVGAVRALAAQATAGNHGYPDVALGDADVLAAQAVYDDLVDRGLDDAPVFLAMCNGLAVATELARLNQQPVRTSPTMTLVSASSGVVFSGGIDTHADGSMWPALLGPAPIVEVAPDGTVTVVDVTTASSTPADPVRPATQPPTSATDLAKDLGPWLARGPLGSPDDPRARRAVWAAGRGWSRPGLQRLRPRGGTR